MSEGQLVDFYPGPNLSPASDAKHFVEGGANGFMADYSFWNFGCSGFYFISFPIPEIKSLIFSVCIGLKQDRHDSKFRRSSFVVSLPHLGQLGSMFFSL